MLTQLHSSHIGIGGYIRCAREILYWLQMSTEIRDTVSRCSICQTHRPAQAREELQPHELPSRPWQKIAADMFVMGQQTFLITVAYWSNYFEVTNYKIYNTTSQVVITQCKVQFARHGIPGVLTLTTSLPIGNMSTERPVPGIRSRMEKYKMRPKPVKHGP